MIISSVNPDGSVTGIITPTISFPMSLQSFVDGKLWPLSSATLTGETFTSNLSRESRFDIMLDTIPVATIERKSALPVLTAGTTLSALV